MKAFWTSVNMSSFARRNSAKIWGELLLRKTMIATLRSSGQHLGPSYETSTPKLHSGRYPDTISDHGGG